MWSRSQAQGVCDQVLGTPWSIFVKCGNPIYLPGVEVSHLAHQLVHVFCILAIDCHLVSKYVLLNSYVYICGYNSIYLCILIHEWYSSIDNRHLTSMAVGHHLHTRLKKVCCRELKVRLSWCHCNLSALSSWWISLSLSLQSPPA